MRSAAYLLAAVLTLSGLPYADAYEPKPCGGNDYSDVAWDSDYFGELNSGCFWEHLRFQGVTQKTWEKKETDRCALVQASRKKAQDACATYHTLKSFTDPGKLHKNATATKQMADELKRDIPWAERKAAAAREVFRPESPYMKEIDGRLGMMQRQLKVVESEGSVEKARARLEKMHETGPLKADREVGRKIGTAKSLSDKKAALDQMYGERSGGVGGGRARGTAGKLEAAQLAGGGMRASAVNRAESKYSRSDSTLEKKAAARPDDYWDKQLRKPMLDRMDQNSIAKKTAADYMRKHPEAKVHLVPDSEAEGAWATFSNSDHQIRINQGLLNREIEDENKGRALGNKYAKQYGNPQRYTMLKPVSLERPLTKDQAEFIADRYMPVMVHEVGGHAVDAHRIKGLPESVRMPAKRDTEYIAHALQAEAVKEEKRKKEQLKKEGKYYEICSTRLCYQDDQLAEVWDKTKDNPKQFKKAVDNFGYQWMVSTEESKDEKAKKYEQLSKDVRQDCAAGKNYKPAECGQALQTADSLIAPWRRERVQAEVKQVMVKDPGGLSEVLAVNLETEAKWAKDGGYAPDFYKDEKNVEKAREIYRERFKQVLKGEAGAQ